MTVVISFCITSANAQEGFGLQTYVLPQKPSSFVISSLGVGFGIQVYPRWVVSLNGDFAEPLVVINYPDGATAYSTGDIRYTIPLELGASVSYRFNDINPTPYVFVGFSHFSPEGAVFSPGDVNMSPEGEVFSSGGGNRSVDLIHAGIGYAPFKGWWFEIYPELSIGIPLRPHIYVKQGETLFTYTPGYVPLTVRATFKLYFDPEIHGIPAWHGVRDTSQANQK